MHGCQLYGDDHETDDEYRNRNANGQDSKVWLASRC